MNFLITAIIVILVIVLRAVYYFMQLKKIKKYKELYLEYIKESQDYSFFQYKQEIVSLFKEAGLKDFGVPHVEPLGFGNLQSMTLSGFDNLLSNRNDVVKVVRGMFEETIGVNKHKMEQSINPFYWIKFFLKLPEKIVSYANIKFPEGLMKFVQLIYWAVGIIVALNALKIIEINKITNH